jgi:toxin-antitoxin system PIN domain toxin
MIALDTNLLVYAHRAGAPQHDQAKQWIMKAVAHPAGWGIASPCLAEFWAVVTHPSCPGGPTSPDQAISFLNSVLQDGGGQVWEALSGMGLRLMSQAAKYTLSGPRIFDLQIAMIARDHGANQIWTYDRQFIAIDGVSVKVIG